MQYDIVIDIGNTRAKTAIYNDAKLSGMFSGAPDLMDLPGWVTEKTYGYGIVSLNNTPDKKLNKVLQQLCKNMIYMSATLPLPLSINHETPDTLGHDRKAACVGAAYLYPEKNLFIIDAGTAITYDFVSASGIMEGGNISPGLSMRFKALHNYTGKLPLLKPGNMKQILGQSTEQSIRNGVQYGIISEVKWYKKLMEKQYKGLITVVTGGDAAFLAKNLKNSIFVHSNLVLIGLYRILKHYVETD